MRIEELYQIAKASGREDYEIEVQYRDGGGYYSGTDSNIEPEWNDKEEIVIL